MSKFVILPCLDSEQMAASRRRELDLSDTPPPRLVGLHWKRFEKVVM